MLGNIGPTTLVLIILIALLLFGPKKLPELGRAFGRTLREFKKGASEVMSDDDDDLKESPKKISQSKAADEDNRRLPD